MNDNQMYSSNNNDGTLMEVEIKTEINMKNVNYEEIEL